MRFRVPLVVGGVLLLIVVVGAASAGRGNTNHHAGSTGTSTTLTEGGNGGVTTTTEIAGHLATAHAEAVASNGSGKVPLTTKVSNTKGLADGDPVSLLVEPDKGSVVYGFEVFLCRGDATYVTDADVRPTYTGKCVTKPLSSVSQNYLVARSGPPYSSAEATFHVGVGTDTYQTRDGKTVSVTCDATNPCALVLKLQFPNDYGFQTIPLTFT